MEWVEVTAKSVESAKELALDRLGIGVDDAEFDVVEEPRPGCSDGCAAKPACEPGSSRRWSARSRSGVAGASNESGERVVAQSAVPADGAAAVEPAADVAASGRNR